MLPPGFVHQDSRSIGQIQAAAICHHRQPQFAFRRESVQNFRRQSARLRTQHKAIARLKLNTVVPRRAFGGHRKQPHITQGLQAGFPVLMHLHAGVFVIIQPSALELLVFQRKPQRLHQMQGHASIGTQADDVSGIGRDFGLEEDEIEQFLSQAGTSSLLKIGS